MGEMDLGDMVLSWSLQEIMDDDLYRGKVETIPCNFNSLDQYLNSYRAPLIEETRSDLCSCLELISEAPSSKILSMEVAGKSGLYLMDVDFWDNGAGFSTETYTARNGDIFILSSMKLARPKKRVTVEDLLSRWEDGESKLQTFISFLRSQKASMEGDRRNEAAAAAEAHSGDQQTGCSDNEPDAGGSNEVETRLPRPRKKLRRSRKLRRNPKNRRGVAGSESLLLYAVA